MNSILIIANIHMTLNWIPYVVVRIRGSLTNYNSSQKEHKFADLSNICPAAENEPVPLS